MASIRLLFFFLFGVISAMAQETHYFSRSFQTMVQEKTENERKYTFENNVTYIEDRTNGSLVKKAAVYGLTEVEKVNAFVWYGYSQANELNYKEYFTDIIGVFDFYRDENPSQQYIIKNKKCLFSQVWNDNQTEVLIYGSGQHKFYSESNDENMVSVYRDSIMVLCYGIRGVQKDTIYYTYDKMALPKGGFQAFYGDLVKQLKYPTGAWFAGKEATVYIQFIVDESGKLSDFKSLSNEGYNFEEKTLKKLKTFPAWEPAVYHGRNVKFKCVLPVRFKLQ